jgi:ABC-type Fe3+ transport system permease subunit
MRWLTKIPGSIRSASGLEWALWRKLPAIWAVGTALPLLALGIYHWLADASTPSAQRALQLADYVVTGIVVFHWTAVLTIAIGCVVVMLMKGPAYVADGLAVSHSDQPRLDPEA